jgi:hypothetical protein
MGKEDAGAKKTHKCCNRLDHREVHCAPRAQNDLRVAQSKGFAGRIDNPDRLVILRNTISVREAGSEYCGLRAVPKPNFRKSPGR